MSEIEFVPPSRGRSHFRIALIAGLIAAFIAFLAAMTAQDMSTQQTHTMPDGSAMPADQMKQQDSK